MKKYGVEEMGKMNRRNKGITLMALVITVIVLLILASITIATFTGNGIITQTKTAREGAEINSEMKIVGTSSNQAKSQNKYGDLKEESFVRALDENAGLGKTEVTYYAGQNVFSVKFVKSERVYFVSSVGNVEYIGRIKNAIMILPTPKGSISLNESYSVNVFIESFAPNEIGSIKYAWTKSEESPDADDYSSENIVPPANSSIAHNAEPGEMEEITNNLSDNAKVTEAPLTITRKEDEKAEKYYLHIKVINGDEIITKTFGPYAVGISSVQLAVDPNGGEWDGKTETSTC